MSIEIALYKILKQRRYPLAKFARDSGITRSHLYRLLDGSCSPTLVTLKQISETLELPLVELVDLIES